jgi:uncharacterized protein YggU (UPF0235/DUF167 family)
MTVLLKVFGNLLITHMRIYVRVVPGSSRNAVERTGESEYRVRLTAYPVEGRANQRLVEALSDYFGVAKSLIVITGGRTARIKTVDVHCVGGS